MTSPLSKETAVRPEPLHTFLPLTPPLPASNAPAPKFLSLSPTVSPSHPEAPTSRRTSVATTASTSSDVTQKEELSSRRSSGAGSSGNKILKLGPVHWGEHLDDHKADFHETR